MKTRILIALTALIAAPVFAQDEPKEEPKDERRDTTTMTLGRTEIIMIHHDTTDIEKEKRSEAHWAGVDFGFSMLMNSGFENRFPENPYWQNDAAKSQTWNINLLEHKFNFGTPYVGLTTGLGFSFTSVAFKNNYILTQGYDASGADTLFAVIDTVNQYSRNKLKASYLTAPLLLEFNTNADADKSFYFAAGVVGGVRMTSKVKRNGEYEGKKFEYKDKGRFGLNAFKLDATVRMGYSDFGVFASYSLLPLFDDGLTADIYPLTFGLSLNF